MSDDPMETITSIEAKAFCLRYGVTHISELDNHTNIDDSKYDESNSVDTIEKIAMQLGENSETIKKSVENTIRKLSQRKFS